MIYRFRAILDHDNKEDIFRDIEIRKTDTFEDLFNVLTQSFGFDGSEMASFYISDDQWQQGQEIALFDMGENEDIRLMNETIIEDIVDEDQTVKENVIVGRLIPAGTGSSIRRLENDAAVRDEQLISENAKNVENEEIEAV